MKVEQMRMSDLSQDPANARVHSERNLDAIRASLRRFGQQKPIVVSADGVIIAGNGTFEAARSLGWDTLNVVVTELEGVDLTAFGIADNRTAELAEWDAVTLSKLIDGLGDDFPVEDLAFSEAELDALLESAGSFDVDDAEPPDLPDGDRAPFQQMKFTLHDDQVELVNAAMRKANEAGPYEGEVNENRNGNALARIARGYLGG